MKIIGLLAASFALLSAQVFAFEKIDLSQMRFTYEDFDGAFNYPCKAEFTDSVSPYDFTVSCFNQSTLVRQFDVHLAVTRYLKNSAPKTKIEVLYWVNHEGATSWLTFQEETAMYEFESSQSIAGEAAALRLKLQLNFNRR